MTDEVSHPPDTEVVAASTRPTFTVSAAAKATGRSRRTIGRLLDAGELEGATRDDSGTWSIPVEALLGAGLAVHAPSPAPEPATPTVPTSTPTTPPVGTPTDETGLRAALADAEHRAELERVKRLAAEERATTAEADRDRWAEQAASLAARMLPTSTDPQTSSFDALGSPRDNSETPELSAPRVRWWNRR